MLLHCAFRQFYIALMMYTFLVVAKTSEQTDSDMLSSFSH